MYRRILGVVDDRSGAQAAVDEAIALAAAHGAELMFFLVLPETAAPVVDPPTVLQGGVAQLEQAVVAVGERRLAEAMRAAEDAGVFARRAMAWCIDEAACIAETARTRRCDLVVVGADDPPALLNWLSRGAVSRLVARSPVPVLVCHAGDERAARRVASG